MKKLFTLFFITLLGISQVWAGQAHVYVYSSPQAGGYVDVQDNSAAPSSYSQTKDHQQIGGAMSSGNKTFYLFYKANPGYNFRNWYKTSESNYNNATTVTDNSDLTSQGQSVTQTASGIGAQNSYYAAVFIPITYTVEFHGNGNTSGSVEAQSFTYDAAQNLRANAYERSFTVAYDANEGVCEQTEALAEYTFGGWATSENGAAVYSDQQSIKNLTIVDGAVCDVYACWANGAIVLPEATREGYLFNGWYDGDTWVGTTGSEYKPTADVTLTAHWAERLTPMFVLSENLLEPGETATLTLTNVDNPSISISPEGVITYDAETGTITALAAGKATISITQEATDILTYKHEDLVVYVKLQPSLSVKINGVEQSNIQIYQGGKATVTFDKVSDAEVEVTTILGGDYVSYADGVVTAGDLGTAVFRATLPETDTYKGTYVEFTVSVLQDLRHLPMDFTKERWDDANIKVATSGTNSWDGDNQIRLGHGVNGGTNWDDKWLTVHFLGIPDKLTFEYRFDYVTENTKNTSTGWFDTEDPNQLYFMYVEESNDNSNWTPLTWQSTDPFKDNWKQSGELQLKKTTRYVRFHLHANLGAYYRNIHISELKYVQDPVPASVDFGSAIIYTGEKTADVDINWCNIAPMSVTSTNPKFTVTPSSFANYDQYGSQKITIAYNHTNEVGDFSGNIVISNGNSTYTKTIPVHAETTKRIQTVTWNEALVATGYAMNVGEQYPDETIDVIATTQSGGLITYTSSNSDVIEVVDDTKLVAKSVGTAEITAYQAGDKEYGEVSDKKEFTVTALQKQSITWDQNLYGLLTTSGSVELNATATSGMEVTYTSANESVVRIEGNNLIVVGEGETYVTATQAGGLDGDNVEWLPISVNNYVIVRNPASQCNEMALFQSSLELNKDHLSQEYALAGVPGTLTFTAKHGEKSGQWGGGTSYAALVVEQFAYLNGLWDWYVVYNKTVGTSDTQSGNISIDESATKIRFATGETGVSHTITNIRIPRKKFLRTDVESVDTNVETNVTWSKEITIDHSNIDRMTLTTKQGILTLSANTLGTGCGDFGADAFTASYTPTEKYIEFLDTIVISDGKATPSTIEIPVRLYSKGMNQYLSDFVLPTSCSTTETVEMPQVTSTSGLEVVFISSDSTVAYVENNVLVILSAGEVKISAYQAGDDRYGAVSSSRTITINLTPIEITEAPTANSIELGQTLSESELIGGNATVEGSFVWTAPETVPAFGTGSYSVTFIPTQSTIYGTATTMVELNVLPPTTYGVFEASFCAGGSAEFNGKTYTESAKEDVKLEIKNIYGGDSIIHVTITANPTYLFPEEETVRQDEAFEWQGQVRATDVIGDYNFKAEYSTEAGCDSIYTLVLHVVSGEPTYGEYTAQMCEDGSVEFAGNTYYGATQDDILLEIKNQYGGDSIVHLTVVENPKYNMPLEKQTVYVNEVFEWQGEVRKTDEIGTFNIKAEYKTEAECDSIYSLELTVIERPTTYGEYTAQFCEGGSVEFAGTTYEAPVANEDVLLEIKNQYGGDSIVHLTVVENKKYNMPLEKQTVYVNEVFEWQGEVRKTDEIGTFNFKAEYKTEAECDSIYSLELTVIERPTTYGEYTAQFCEGGSVEFAGTTYEAPVANEDVLLEIKNQYGGDSIVHLTVIENKKYNMPLEKQTVYVNEVYEWQGEVRKTDEIGTFNIKAEYKTEAECDSIYSLELTVIERPTTYGEYTAQFCEGGSVEFAGQVYESAVENEDILLDEKNQFGGDSIVHLTVIELKKSASAEEMKMYVGEDKSWNGIALKDSTAGVYTIVYETTNAAGCDSTVTLTLTIEKQAAYEAAYTIYTCAGEPVEYRGKSYSEAGPYEVTVEDAVRDTTIALTVVVYATDHQDLYETVKVGDAIELGEQSWRTADGWNISGTYDVEEEDLGEIEFTLTLKNENGCDSVIVRHVTVEEAEKPETPTALDNVEADSTAFKVLRDGVIYIRRGDSLYTIEGRKAE